jgi:hypothetical protein
LLGIVSLAGVWAAWRMFHELNRSREGLIAAALVGFWFLNPLFSTRVLIEGAGAPFLTLGALFATRYWNTGTRKNIGLALLGLAIASVFRFQSGVCAGAVLALVLLRRDWKGVGVFVLAAAALFALTGGLDYAARGEFHGSLRRYVSYNLKYASAYYGTSPFYLYLLLFVGLSLPPTFLARYRNFAWTERFRPLLPVLLFFLFFFGAHSAIGHKEERFMVTVLPVFLCLLAPLLDSFWRMPNQRWRVRYFAALNLLLLIPTSFSVPQNNIIAAAGFVDHNPQIRRAVSLEQTLDFLFPLAFIERAFPIPTAVKLDRLPEFVETARERNEASCGTVYFVRQDLLEGRDLAVAGLTRVAEFRPGPLEALVVKLNPRKNARRGAVGAYAPAGCHYIN